MADPTYPNEEWRAIPFAPNYAVSNLGRVKRLTRGRSTRPGYILSPVSGTGGYLVVGLHAEGRLRTCRVSRLVAIAFLGDPPSPKHHVAHWDGTRTNNVVGNLRWATAKENCADKRRHGRDSSHRRFFAEHIEAIRRDKADGMRARDIMAKHGVGKSALYRFLKA